ncbi:bactofilin family protein [Rubrobacter indicoceani]|uniref:bactofilin family protein n=1 Tax=Rubrobacter indicoceani TaxID=2051957 RepID=UPI000E5AA1F3|nr:polymer-forming cytoskeletal protein [Rubrobacter indicoceani]
MTPAVPRRAVGRSPGLLILLATLTGLMGFLLIPTRPVSAATPGVPDMSGVDPNRPIVVERGQVAPEVSSAMGRVEVYGVVKGDVSSTVGNITVRGPVGGDVESGLGSIRVEAPVGGDVEAGFGDVYVNDFVEGNIEVERGDVVLGPGAVIKGDVHCGTGLCQYEEGALVGGRMMAGNVSGATLGEATAPSVFGGMSGWLLGAGLLCGASILISVVAPAQLAASSRMVESHPGWSMLVGLGSVVGGVVASLLLAVSVIGLPLLILIAPLYLGLVAFGAVVAAFFVGRKVVFAVGGYRQGNVLAAVVGAAIVAAAGLLPLGGMLLTLISLLGAGAALMALLRGTALFRKYLPGNGFRRE